ncbi:MAG: hypothetical protein AAFQ36_01300 [Pseudomonadota bacterium]
MNLKLTIAATAAALTLTACGGGSLVQPGVPTGFLEIQNDTRENLGVVTISQCSASSHGGNRMGFGNWIEPGDSAEFEISEGCYDIQAGGSMEIDGSFRAATTRMNIVAGQRSRFTVR